MNPKISIVVPVYNVENYLHKCIDSILEQTFSEFELILVNDGSPDNCGPICDEYAKKDKRIKVIHQKNSGLSSARNKGIEAAIGQYVGFIDSDDYVDKKMFEILYNIADYDQSDIVICDFLKVKENESPDVYQFNLNFNVHHYTNVQALMQLYSADTSNQDQWVIACNKLYNKSLFRNLRFKEGRIYEDEFIVHKIFYNSKKITFISKKLYFYLQRNNSIVGSPFNVKKFDRVYALKERVDFFRKIKLYHLSDLALKHYIEVFLLYYFKGKSELCNIDTELKHLKKTVCKSLRYILENSFISSKQKFAMVLFVLSPFVFEKVRNYMKKRDKDVLI